MLVIIAEKPIAGKRIADILNGHASQTRSEGRVPSYALSYKGQEALVVPLRGHVLDVDFPKQYSYWQGTPLEKLAKAPVEYIATEKAIVDYLMHLAPQISHVIIATDADREGEAIGVEAVESIWKVRRDIPLERAYYSAIAPKDIHHAFDHLTKVDFAFADSANARREIDLVWGSVLTRYLSLTSGKLGKEFLSMGRVQGPTMALVVHREKERLAFVVTPYWEVHAKFEKDGQSFGAEHKHGRFLKKEEAEAVLSCREPPIGIVVTTAKKTRSIEKPLPFNTTLFIRAATSIGFTAGKAMEIAEQLYQAGFTSYPRTDNSVYPESLDLRETLKEMAKSSAFHSDCEKLLVKQTLVPSKGKETKDHPPIYPVTHANPGQLSPPQWKIFELIVRRFLATLAEDATTENVLVEIDLNTQPFIARGQTYLRLGWKAFYPYSKAEDVELPKLEKGDRVRLQDLQMLDKQTEPPARFSQGSLITEMEKLGLGTKATRHEIIQKLYVRKYFAGQKAIEPTLLAMAVVDAFEKHAPRIVQPVLTHDLEDEMDEVAAGKKKKEDVVDSARQFLEESLNQLQAHKTEVRIELKKGLRGDNVIGICKKCGQELVIRIARVSGKRFIGCSGYPACSNSFPLPQKGTLSPLNKECPTCQHPLVEVRTGKGRPWQMCINMACASKDEWRARQEAQASSATTTIATGAPTPNNPKKIVVKKRKKADGKS